MRPPFSSTWVKAASAFLTTVAVQPPSSSDSGIAVVEPYGRVAQSERSTRLHLERVKSDALERLQPRVSRLIFVVGARM